MEFTEYRDRLLRAIESLGEKRIESSRPYERDRLAGKVEGVKLALSYLDEEGRTAPESVPLIPDDRNQMEALARATVEASGVSWSSLGASVRQWHVRVTTAAVRGLLPSPPRVELEEPTALGACVTYYDGGGKYFAVRLDGTRVPWALFSCNATGAPIRFIDWICWDDVPGDVEIVRIGTGVES